MVLYDLKKELKKVTKQNIKKNNLSLNKDVILCNHCKRTLNNGIRCMGICVADNEY